MNEQTLTEWLKAQGYQDEKHELSNDPCLGNEFYQVILFEDYFTISFDGDTMDFRYPKTEAEAQAIFSNLLYN